MALPSLDPRLALRVGFYALLALLLALGVRALTASGPSIPDDTRDILSADLARRNHANALALDSATQRLAIAQSKVAPAIVRYREIRDTFRITDTLAVKEFVQRADSVVRRCTELVESCATFRVRAESSLAGLTLDRDRWRLQAESERPSGLSLFVRRTLPVVAFVGGVWIGSKVTK